MQKKRIILFLVMIFVGIAASLFYGWILNPVKYVDTSAASLRSDYKTDYVLMVAEIYQSDANTEQASARLSLISAQPPVEVAADGLQTARSLGYSPADLRLIENLSQALQIETPPPNEEQP